MSEARFTELPPPIRSTVTGKIQDLARKVSKSLNRKKQSCNQVLRKKGEGRDYWHHLYGRQPRRAVSLSATYDLAPPSPPGPRPPSCQPGFPPGVPLCSAPAGTSRSRPTKARLGSAPSRCCTLRHCARGEKRRPPRLQATLLRAHFTGGGEKSQTDAIRSRQEWAPRTLRRGAGPAHADATGIVSSL